MNGYKFSRDYQKLYEFICAGHRALAFVDYKSPDTSQVYRDPCAVTKIKEWEIDIGARGAYYPSVYTLLQTKFKTEQEALIAACEKINLEWVEPCAEV